jgi:hypothetical protein
MTVGLAAFPVTRIGKRVIADRSVRDQRWCFVRFFWSIHIGCPLRFVSLFRGHSHFSPVTPFPAEVESFRDSRRTGMPGGLHRGKVPV